jgi:hypothetical protein
LAVCYLMNSSLIFTQLMKMNYWPAIELFASSMGLSQHFQIN